MADWVGTELPTRLGRSHVLQNTTLNWNKIDRNSTNTGVLDNFAVNDEQIF